MGISSIAHFDSLRNSKEFQRVYHKSNPIWHTPLFVLFYKEAPDSKIGFVASKKVGNAVARNRAKRLLRAVFIENIDRAQTGHYALVAKPPLLNEPYSSINKYYKFALKRVLSHSSISNQG